MDDHLRLTPAQPAASPEETAAVMAAVEQFMRDTGPESAPSGPAATRRVRPWHWDPLQDGISRQPGAMAHWE
jgi:hypothetical protein